MSARRLRACVLSPQAQCGAPTGDSGMLRTRRRIDLHCATSRDANAAQQTRTLRRGWATRAARATTAPLAEARGIAAVGVTGGGPRPPPERALVAPRPDGGALMAGDVAARPVRRAPGAGGRQLHVLRAVHVERLRGGVVA